MAIVVYEYSLFVPVEVGRYFSIGGALSSGNAVLYSFGAEGETVDFDESFLRHVIFYESAAVVEQAIAAGQVRRPQISVNGDVSWRWPAPKPAGMTP